MGNDAIYTLFEDMRKDGVDPDLNAYNIMLNFAALKHNEDRAYMYLHQLTSMQLEADIDTYNALMAVFAPNGGEMVHKVFEDMARHHVPPDSTTLGILMKHRKGRTALGEAAARGLVKIENMQAR